MHARPPCDRGARILVAVLVPTLAAWNNVVAHRLSRRGYVAVNGAAAAALLAAARTAGISGPELGLDLRNARAGVRLGASCTAPVAAAYAVALALPAARPLLRDERAAGRSLGFEILVRIPVGTVLWEEVAFRGVLDAALCRLLPAGRAAAAGAALFGLWHVRPTMDALAANGLGTSRLRTVAAVLAACSGTAAAGVLFTGIRRRSGSLLAPLVLHLGVNAPGLLAAAAAHRRGSGTTSPRRLS